MAQSGFVMVMHQDCYGMVSPCLNGYTSLKALASPSPSPLSPYYSVARLAGFREPPSNQYKLPTNTAALWVQLLEIAEVLRQEEPKSLFAPVGGKAGPPIRINVLAPSLTTSMKLSVQLLDMGKLQLTWFIMLKINLASNNVSGLGKALVPSRNFLLGLTPSIVTSNTANSTVS